MKKTILYLSILLLAACSTEQKPLPVADGAPIIPMRMHQSQETMYLTDYTPTFVSDDNPMDSVVIYDNGMIQFVNINDSTDSAVVVVMPNLPYRNAMTATLRDDSICLQFSDPKAGERLIAVMLQNRLAEQLTDWAKGSCAFALPATHLKGRSYLRIFAADSAYCYNDILIPLQDGKPIMDASQLDRHDDHAQVLYSLMIDRFANGNTSNDWKLNSPEVLDIVDYQGGDFAGITRKIEEGWFDSLGISTIWISPITQNPWTAWGYYPFHKRKDGSYDNKFDSTKAFTRFSGYHGYWPIYATALEKRFGTEEEFRTMLETAHKHGLNVILDYVANHMHIEAATYQEHPDWHTDSILPDGRRNFELWDEQRLTTWFDTHIPTLDLEREEVCGPMTDSALYWLTNYDIDGFRHDACKHIPLNYWRLLGRKMALRFPGRHIWMVGETYGSPELIGSYVKSGMFPAQFDFNIYHKAIDILGKPNQDMRELESVILQSLATYGSHHTMGNISGNHDKCRFISLAGGAVDWNENDKMAGWTRECGVTADNDPAREERAYRAAMLLEVLNMTIPGVPCIYQGDEFAKPGANDPDNRGMMQFSGYSPRQQQFRREMESLIKLRRSSMPLLYGDYIPVSCDEDKLVFDRTYLGQTVRVTLDKSDMTYKIENL